MSWIQGLSQVLGKPLRWWVTVAEWEQAVLVRLGKHTYHLKPGVHLRIPFLDRVYRVCVRERVRDADNRTVSSSDGKPFTVAISIRYSIRDASALMRSVAKPEATLETIAQTAVAERVAMGHSGQITPNELSDWALSELQAQADGWGLEITRVCVTSFSQSRVIRLLQGQDHGYGSAIDGALDKEPATVD